MIRVTTLVLCTLLCGIVPSIDSGGRWNFNFDDPSGTSPTGPPQHGVALALIPPSTVLRTGSPMWIMLEFRNVSTRWVNLNGLFRYGLEVVNRATGDSVKNPDLADPDSPTAIDKGMRAVTGPLGARSLIPKHSAFGAIRLDELYQLKPGSYLVRAVARNVSVWFAVGNSPPADVTFESNTIAFDVLPARPSNPSPVDTRGISEGAAGNSPIGGISHGFALSLKAGPAFEAPAVVAELRNLSGHPKQVRFTGMAYVITVRNLRTGRVVVVGSQLLSWHAESRFGAPVYPDTSLYARFDPAKQYALEGDRYLVTVAAYPQIDGVPVTLQSNAIVLTVSHRDSTVPFAPSNKVLATGVSSNRPVYIQGQPILLRITVTNQVAQEIIMGAGQVFGVFRSFGPHAVSLSACKFSNAPTTITHPIATLIGAHATVVLQNFRRWNRWATDFSRAGCRFDEPGVYEIIAAVDAAGIAQGAGVNYSFSGVNIRPSEPLQIKVVTKQDARAIAPAQLLDASENAAIRQQLSAYSMLRGSLLNVIAHVAQGETQSQVIADSGAHWPDNYDTFRSTVDALSGLGDPSSPYVNVTANLDEASYHLREANQDAHDYCDPVAARREVDVADYFIAAVRDEMRRMSASILDASAPAASLEPRSGLCRWQ